MMPTTPEQSIETSPGSEEEPSLNPGYSWSGGHAKIPENRVHKNAKEFEDECIMGLEEGSNDRDETENNALGNTIVKEATESYGQNGASGDDYECIYPPDCYSFISLHGPSLEDWKSLLSPNESSVQLRMFTLGLTVFFVQCALISMMWFSVLHPKWGTREEDNPGESNLAKVIAANASPVLQATQFIALLSYVMFTDASMTDITTAVETFPIYESNNGGSDDSKKIDDGKLWCHYLSCVLRCVQGAMAVAAAFLLVVTSDTAVDVVLNFAAVNFISELDNVAFQMALDGRYGRQIRMETKRIENRPLPSCMSPRDNRTRYKWTTRLLGVVLMGFMIAIYLAQNNIGVWRTNVIKVKFQGKDLEQYSGCYHRQQEGNLIETFRRDSYADNATTEENARFGYCGTERRWMLFKNRAGDHVSALDTCNLEEKKLAYSEQTDSFDIITGLKGGWYSAFGAPLNYYVMDLDGNDNDCFLLGNGECNADLNKLRFNYDDGDCCSATCSHPNCGKSAVVEAFNASNINAHGFSQCKDPSMVPITILLGDFRQSPTVRKIHNPNLRIECDGKVVLSLDVQKSMINGSQTILVKDSADCAMKIRNHSSYKDPMWFVDYSIFIGDKVNGSMKIIQDNSEITGTLGFSAIPECMLEKLSEQVDIFEIHNDVNAKLALEWVAKDKGKSNCEDPFFIERYGLSVVNFAAPMNDISEGVGLWINSNPTCLWFTTECADGVPSDLSLSYLNLKGSLPKYVKLLTSFSTISMRQNFISGPLPSEIGMMSNLKDLDLYNNELTGSLPSEIGKMTNLTRIGLFNNSLTGSLPSQIGMMSNMRRLFLDVNELTGTLPSEIGMMANLKEVILFNNSLTGSLPSEIGMMSNVTHLFLYNNLLTGSLPSEIGMMSNLKSVVLFNNKLTGSVPSQIGRLSNLEVLHFYNNSLTGSLPSEIGMVSKLKKCDFGSNSLSGPVPSEIGLLTNLRCLSLLEGNNFASIPNNAQEILDKTNTCTWVWWWE